MTGTYERCGREQPLKDYHTEARYYVPKIEPWMLCDDCTSNEAESAHERSMSDYYGGSGPTTLQEQYDAAAALKRSLQ